MHAGRLKKSSSSRNRLWEMKITHFGFCASLQRHASATVFVSEAPGADGGTDANQPSHHRRRDVMFDVPTQRNGCRLCWPHQHAVGEPRAMFVLI